MLILVLAWCLGAMPSTAEAPGTPVVWGLIVGVEKPAGLAIPPRAHARQDAQNLYDEWTSARSVAAAPERVWLLLDSPDPQRPAKQATVGQFRAMMQSVARQAGPDDQLTLFLKTSGEPSGDEFRYYFADSSEPNLSATTLLSSELAELLAAIPCTWVLSLLDVATASPGESKEIRAGASWRHVVSGLTAPGRFVISAGDGQQLPKVSDATQSGVFANRILRGVRGEADRDGGEPDGWITWHELGEWVRAAPEYQGQPGPRIRGEGELPWIPLARVPSVRDRVNQQIDQLRQLRAKGELDDASCADGQLLLGSQRRSAAEQSLRQAYVKLLAGQITKNELLAKRRDLQNQRRLSPEDAEAFASLMRDARRLIDQRYLKPQHGASALSAGLRVLAIRTEQNLTAWRPRFETIARDDEAKVHDLLLQFRLAIGKRDDLDSSVIDQICLAAMMRSLDPYSTYFTESTFRDFQHQNDGEFAGIGVKIRDNGDRLGLVVETPLLNSPALRAGIEAGDHITAIDGKSMLDIGFEEASRLLEGNPGTKIRLTIQHANRPGPVDVDLVCENIGVESVLGVQRLEDQTWDYWLDRPSAIGYVRLATFARDTAEELRRVLRQMRRDGMNGLVLDLRFNPGGLLPVAVDVADIFLDDGVIVTVRDRMGETVLRGNRFGTIRDVDLVVLINRSSASGSEIVAAALADHGRATLIGERSFGKGSVQSLFPLTRGRGAIKLTTASFQSPKGTSLHRFPDSKPEDPWGVRPESKDEVALSREDARRIQLEMGQREVIAKADDRPKGVPKFDKQLERALHTIINDRRSEAAVPAR